LGHLREHDLDRVRGRTVDAADLRHLLDLVQDVHRVALAEEDDERVARRDRQSVADGELDELLVVALWGGLTRFRVGGPVLVRRVGRPVPST
jgi:hypothetical protein